MNSNEVAQKLAVLKTWWSDVNWQTTSADTFIHKYILCLVYKKRLASDDHTLTEVTIV